MRRAPAWVVVVGVVALWTGLPGQAQADGFWVTIAAGVAGASSPSDYSEFWFESPHAPPLAVNQITGLPGSFSAQAVTAGGNAFFNNDATPVLLPTTDGYASLTNREVANGSGGLPRFANSKMASGAPQVGAAIPSDANLLSATLTDPTEGGTRVLTVDVTNSAGKPLGSGHVQLPDGGWWVVGLGPGSRDGTEPGPIGGGDDGEGPTNPGPVDPPPAHGGSGSVTTPEPASLVLIGVGGLSVAGWRRLRRK